MFPTSIEGTLDLPERSPAEASELLRRIERALVQAKANDLVRSNDRISFRGGVFRAVSSWNVLGPVGSGVIEVVQGSPSTIRYDFSCMELLIIVTLMAVVLGLSMIHGSPSSMISYVLPILAWLWLFGMNYIVASVRLPNFVKRAIDA